MSANQYDIGDSVRVSGAFTVASVATDPTTITLKILKPGATTATTYTYALAEITKDSTGNYHKDISLDTAGVWYYRWAGTGTVATVEEGYFDVRVPVIA